MSQTYPGCLRPAEVVERFDCGGCGRPPAAYGPCGHLAAVEAAAGHCEMCAPVGTGATPDQIEHLRTSLRRMVDGLAEGRAAMTSRSAPAYDHYRIITEAWIAAGRPRKGDPGWREWLGTKYQLGRQLGSSR